MNGSKIGIVKQGLRIEAAGATPPPATEKGRLFEADSLKLPASIPSESVHCVFADPPFNLKKQYHNGFEDALDERTYLDWCFQWIDECCRVLAPGGAFFIYSLPKWSYHFP